MVGDIGSNLMQNMIRWSIAIYFFHQYQFFIHKCQHFNVSRQTRTLQATIVRVHVKVRAKQLFQLCNRCIQIPQLLFVQSLRAISLTPSSAANILTYIHMQLFESYKQPLVCVCNASLIKMPARDLNATCICTTGGIYCNVAEAPDAQVLNTRRETGPHLPSTSPPSHNPRVESGNIARL